MSDSFLALKQVVKATDERRFQDAFDILSRALSSGLIQVKTHMDFEAWIKTTRDHDIDALRRE